MLTHSFSANSESELLIWRVVTASIRSAQHKRGLKPQEEIWLDSSLLRPSYQSCHPTPHMAERGGAKLQQTSLAPMLALNWQLATFVRQKSKQRNEYARGTLHTCVWVCDKVWLLSQFKAIQNAVQLYGATFLCAHTSSGVQHLQGESKDVMIKRTREKLKSWVVWSLE